MEALQQSMASLNVNGSLSSCVRACSSSKLATSRVAGRSAGSSTALICNTSSLKAKVQEQMGSSSITSSRVVAMAKSAGSGYAAALAEVSQSKGLLDSVLADVETLGAYTEDEQFWNFISSPVVKESDKKDVLKSLAKEAKFQSVTLNLLNLIVDKKRTLVLKDLIKEFEELYNELTDTQVATVTSAVEINESQLSLIGKKVKAMSGSKNIKLKNVVDPSIIAGFIVRFGKDGSRLIDMSVKGQLDRIASQIDLADKTVAAF